MSRIRLLPSLMLGTALILLNQTVQAQTPGTGWWIGAGAGVSRFELKCDLCTGPASEDMPTGTFSLAFRPWRPIAFSFEAAGLVGARGTVTERQGSLLGTAQLYPVPSFPAYFQVGTGWNQYRTAFGADANAPRWRSRGAAWLVGVGGEWMLRPDLAFAPRFTLLSSDKGTLAAEGSEPGEFEQSYTIKTFSVSLLYRIHSR